MLSIDFFFCGVGILSAWSFYLLLIFFRGYKIQLVFNVIRFFPLCVDEIICFFFITLLIWWIGYYTIHIHTYRIYYESMYSHEQYWFAILFSCNMFIRFWNQSSSDSFSNLFIISMSFSSRSFLYQVYVLFFSFSKCEAILIGY